jgi:hypothetical protein
MILLGLLAGSYCWSEYRTVSACVLVAVLAAGILGCIFWTPIETRYECLCDQGTSYTQVAENWNVVKQRGELWVVTAKEGADAVVR